MKKQEKNSSSSHSPKNATKCHPKQQQQQAQQRQGRGQQVVEEQQQKQHYNKHHAASNAAAKQYLLQVSPTSANAISANAVPLVVDAAAVAEKSSRQAIIENCAQSGKFHSYSAQLAAKSSETNNAHAIRMPPTNTISNNLCVPSSAAACSAELPPPSPTHAHNISPLSAPTLTRSTLEVSTLSASSTGQRQTSSNFYDSYLNPSSVNSGSGGGKGVILPSPIPPALEETVNRRRLSNSPLNSFTKLNNIRKKSISEISLILEVIRSAAKPVDRTKEFEKSQLQMRSNERITASASPYLVKSRRAPYASPTIKEQNDKNLTADNLSGANLRRTSISANNLITPTIDLAQNAIYQPNANASSPLTNPTPRNSRKGVSGSRSLSPTLLQISSFLRHKKGRSRGIRWERLSPYNIQRQMNIVQEEKAMQLAPSAPIDASKFVAYVQERRKKRILFKGEYLVVLRSVDPQKCGTTIGALMGERNQYPDTLPYDHNRVVLRMKKMDADEPYRSYINASYVQSWLQEKAYVVTQAVKTKQASNQFWRLVWEMRSNCIVMLTKVFDFMRVMCLQYWPMGKFQFGDIEVETLETKSYAHFVIRTFSLRRLSAPVDGDDDENDGPRIVKHFHFTEWELNSFPYISAFIELRRRVRQWTDQNPNDAPIIVHCSNGGGRSGAFLALDASMELMRRTGHVDVFEYAKTLLNSRQHLIESVEQYTFIYDVICEALLCNIEPIAMHQLKDRSSMYKSKKDRELMEIQDSHENRLLLMLTPTLRIGDCAGGHRLENRGKNRDVMVVPPDHARPYLQTLHGESKDYTYINAVEVDGFTRKSEFIVTEWPKPQTLDSFWTLIFDHSVHTVINLTNQQSSHSKLYPSFIHSKGKRNYGPFMVEILNHQQYPGLSSYMVKITKRVGF